MDAKNSVEKPNPPEKKSDEKNIPVRDRFSPEEYDSIHREIRSVLDPSVSDLVIQRAKQAALALSPKDTEICTLIEERIKKGSTGLELIEYVKQLAQCDSAKAFELVRDTSKRSADVIRATFSQDQVIVMAFDLYSRACLSNKIQDAARLLQAIIALVNEQNTLTKQQLAEKANNTRVNIVEFLPPTTG